jgi:LysR family transcriptional activator of nhaA
MERLNYHHLFYFWTVAREGSIARACQRLRVSQPTISTQLQALEAALGEELFDRAGRRLVLTDAGRHVFAYAEDIFALGQEMTESLRGLTGRRRRFEVGIADSLAKLLAYRLLEPALKMKETVLLVCREDRGEQLLAALSVHRLDLVITDEPLDAGHHIKAYNHLLGESTVTLFATPALARRLRRGFPRSLDGVPFLWPTEDSPLRRALEQWCDEERIRPERTAEFQDSATMKAFGHAGSGVFPAPTAVEADVVRQYRVSPLARLPAVRERYYAISVERRITHPAVAAISEAARSRFAGPPAAR